MNTYSVTLHNAQAGHAALQALWQSLKPHLVAGNKIQLEAFDGKTREQENLAHSCISDIARDALFCGAKASKKRWKESLKYSFYLGTKDDPDYVADWRTRKPEMVPLIDGDGFVMTSIETRHFTKNLYRAWITFLHATGDARGVNWSPTSLGREWSEIT